MINEIVSGISEKLAEAFGEDYEFYTEQVKQGEQLPCFHISCVSPMNRLFMGNTYQRDNLFSVRYMPQNTPDWKTECYTVQGRLFIALEYITVAGVLVRGTGMSGQIVDGALVMTLNYNVFVRTVPEFNPMETLQPVNVKPKG